MCYFLFKLLQYLLCNSFFIFAILQKYRLNSNGLPVGLSFEFLTIQIVQYSLKLHPLHSTLIPQHYYKIFFLST